MKKKKNIIFPFAYILWLFLIFIYYFKYLYDVLQLYTQK